MRVTTYCGVCPVKSWRMSRAGVAWAQVSRRSDTGPVPGGVVMNDQMSREPKGAGIRLSGMTGFTVMWVGQVVSLVGSAATSFAVMVWLWRERARHALCPVWNSDDIDHDCCEPAWGGAGRPMGSQGLDGPERLGRRVSTIAMLVLHRECTRGVASLCARCVYRVFGALQFPAFSAAVTVMLPKRHYARASAMRSMAETVGISLPHSQAYC